MLWDCISLLDEATIAIVKGLGGLIGIAISHPHYYSSMVEWAHAFDAPVHLHASDREWVMRPDPSIKFWDGDTLSLARGVTLIRCGGHFAGGTVLHWAQGAGKRGALLSGDIVQVIPDRKFVTFMRSYPEHDPALGAGRRAHRRHARAVSVRCHPRRLVRPHNSPQRQGHRQTLDRPLRGGGARRRFGRTALTTRSTDTWRAIEAVKRENLTPRQQQLHDDFLKSRPRKTLTGPFAVLIHTPDIAEPADRLVNYYRQKSETRPRGSSS